MKHRLIRFCLPLLLASYCVLTGTESKGSSIASPYPEGTPFYNLIMIAHMEHNHERIRELVDWKLGENPQHPLALMTGYYAALLSGDKITCEDYSERIFSLVAKADPNEDYTKLLELFKAHEHPQFEEMAKEFKEEDLNSNSREIDYGVTNWIGNIAVAISKELGRDDPQYLDEMKQVSESWIETRTKHILSEKSDDELVSIAQQLIEREVNEGDIDLTSLPHPLSDLHPIEIVCGQSEVRVLLWKMVNASVGFIITIEKNSETENVYYPTKRLSENLLWFQTNG